MRSTSLLPLNETTRTEFETKFSNNTQVSEVLVVIEGAVNAECEPVWMTTVMLHSCMHPTAILFAQTCCIWPIFWKLHMAGHGNRWEGVGWRKVRKLGYTYQKLLEGSTCRKLLADSAGTWSVNIIHHSDNLSSGGSQIERHRSIWMLMNIRWTDILAVNNDYMHFSIQLLSIQLLWVCH